MSLKNQSVGHSPMGCFLISKENTCENRKMKIQ